jgi:phosphopantetheinyl transferase (holo-ACP synthase)
MTSSTWTFRTSYPVRACGIDCEKIGRFAKWAGPAGDRPPAFVFSEGEIGYVRTLPDPSFGLCASFCCKEAVYKALGESYDFPECELLFDPARETSEVRLSNEVRSKFRIDEAVAMVRRNPLDDGELIVVVYLCGPGRP